MFNESQFFRSHFLLNLDAYRIAASMARDLDVSTASWLVGRSAADALSVRISSALDALGGMAGEW